VTDDIVERLRNHWRAAGQGCTSLCRECTAADEIERLRDENEAWRSLDQIRLKLIRMGLAETARLQALIDSWAVAHEAWMVRCATNSLYPELPADSVGLPTLMKAERVLLAAATPKEDD